MSFGGSYRLVIVFCIFAIILFKMVNSLENFSDTGNKKIFRKRNLSESLSVAGPEAQDWRRSSQEDSQKQLPFFDKKEIEAQKSLGPNLVEAIDLNDPGIDVRKLKRLEISRRRTKEMLVLEYIVEDYNFVNGEDVVEWFHVWDGGKEYFVGRREQSFQIVRLDYATYEVLYAVNVGVKISFMTVYSFWNTLLEVQEGVLLVTNADRISWYRYNPNTKLIELHWEWKTGQYITSMTYFTIDSTEYLAVTTNQSSPTNTGFYDLKIFQFIIHTKEFWIVQRLPLRFPCHEVAIIDTGRDIVLAVPQQNKALVYTFNPHASFSSPSASSSFSDPLRYEASPRLEFKLLSNFASDSIRSVSAFKMGGRHYLALGGLQPRILSYQQGKFATNTIFGETFGLVELFLPIPLSTYRDDLILLVQRRIDFSTHFVTILESLIWDGEAFETIIPVPCHQGSHTAYGVTCMLDMHRDEGLKGAAVLKQDARVAVLVPRHKATSGLFTLHTKMLTANSEYKDLEDIYAFLKEWVQEEDELIAQAQEFLESGGGGPDFELDVKELELVETPELLTWAEIGEVYINDYRWTTDDLAVDLDHLLLTIQQLGYNLLPTTEQKQQLQYRQKREVPQDEDMQFDTLEVDEVVADDLLLGALNNEQYFIQEGSLDFEGILNIDTLEVLPTLASPTSKQESLTLLNLNLDQINGVKWEEFERGLVFRNKPLMLDGLTVKGEVVMEIDLMIDKLNDLRFPDDFLWSSGPSSTVVQAEKIFLGTLLTNNLDTEGSINDINPSNAITLSEEQNWTGVATFRKLKVLHFNKPNSHGRSRVAVREEGEDEGENNEQETKGKEEAHTEEKQQEVVTNVKDLIEASEVENTENKETGKVETENDEAEGEKETDKEGKEEEIDNINKDELDTKKILADEKFIRTDCIFDHLEIQGTLFLAGEYEKGDLANTLTDIVQRPEAPDETVHIESPKTFSSIKFPVDFRLESNLVNDIPVDQFIMSNTEQELNINALNGNVFFNNLSMGEAATFDGVNIYELHRNALKIDEVSNQTVQLKPKTKLNFLQNPGIEAEFVVGHSLNGVIIASDCQTVREDLVIKTVNGNVLEANLIEIIGDVEGTARLNGHNLNNLLGAVSPSTSSSSSSLDDPDMGQIDGNIYIDELALQACLTTDKLQDIDSQHLMDFLDDLDDMPVMIAAGKAEVSAIIAGDILAQKLNGEDFDEDIQKTVIWLNRANYVKANLKFAQSLYLEADLNCEGLLNDQNLPEVIPDMVFRNETNGPHLVWATKNFINDIHVNGNTKLDAINGLRFHRIATKSKGQRLKGTIKINGNLYVQSFDVSGSLNVKNSLRTLTDLVSYDRHLRAFVLHGEVIFNRSMSLQDLTVLRDLNDFRNLSGFFEELIYKDKACRLKGMKSFTGRVSIDGGLYVRNLNGYNVLALLSNVVTINEMGSGWRGKQIINSPVRFTVPASIHVLTVQNDFKSDNINGCELKSWFEDSLWLDREQKIDEVLQFAPGAMDGNSLSVDFLNEVELSRVITLHTPQVINASFIIPHLYLDGVLRTDEGLVNEIELQEEYENTMMIHGNQHVSTHLIMSSCRVLRNLKTNAPVNRDKDLAQVATLWEPKSLELSSPLFLYNITARRVYTNDLVSGIDLNQWHRNALWSTHQRPRQWITGNWMIHSLNVRNHHERKGNKDGIANLTEPLRSVRATENFTAKSIGGNYRYSGKLAEDRNITRIYFVKYLEEAFKLSVPSNETKRSTLFSLPYDSNVDYILLNIGCYSYIYEWNVNTSNLSHTFFVKFESGFVDQLLPLENGKMLNESSPLRLGFVTNVLRIRNNLNCSQSGLNIWTLEGLVVKHAKYLGNNYSAICQKLPASSNFQAKQIEAKQIHEFSAISLDVVDIQSLPSIEEDEPLMKINVKKYDRTRYVQGIKDYEGIKEEKPKHERNEKFDLQEIDNTSITASSSGDNTSLIEIKHSDVSLEMDGNGEPDQLLNQSSKYERSLFSFPTLFASAANRQRQVPDKSQSQSKPLPKIATTTAEHSIHTSADFEEVVEVILNDLSQSLGREINIIRLSIPESDLYEVHLMQDFIDVITQIQDSGRMTDINWQDLQLPSNPAQVLAGRSIIFTWPVITEIEKAHSQVEETKGTMSNYLVFAIKKTLLLAIKDLLNLAYRPSIYTANNHKDTSITATYQSSPLNSSEEDDGGIVAIIIRLHKLQNDLAQIVNGINLQFKKELETIEKSGTKEEGEEEREDSINGGYVEIMPLPLADIAKAKMEEEEEGHDDEEEESQEEVFNESRIETMPVPLVDTASLARNRMEEEDHADEEEEKDFKEDEEGEEKEGRDEGMTTSLESGRYYTTEDGIEILTPPLADNIENEANLGVGVVSKNDERLKGKNASFVEFVKLESFNTTTMRPQDTQTIMQELREENEKDDALLKLNWSSVKEYLTEKSQNQFITYLSLPDGGSSSRKGILLEVGPATESHFLVGFFEPEADSLVGQQPGILLYIWDDNNDEEQLHRHLFQSINAQKPREVTTIRISDETLLAFIENCCKIRVLVYRGIRGFIELTEIVLSQRIFSLSALKLRGNAQKQRNFMTANLGERIVFYEVVMAGQ